ncbi:MAG: glycosyltransferase [Ferruginibacter sp.]
MVEKYLHIISFEIPSPADYGGVIDVFYKLKALHNAGVKIHLHCFYKNRKPAPDLEQFCETVSYYPRQVLPLHLKLPYIVASRTSDVLRQRLAEDDFPVLLEGIHCTALLQSGFLDNRRTVLRMHNLENIYYNNLAKNESQPLKKLFFQRESRRLLIYEKKIAPFVPHLALTTADKEALLLLNPGAEVTVIPAFIPWQICNFPDGTGTYCLYHGNLAINENEKAVVWLLDNVFNGLNADFIIAGKNPGKALVQVVSKNKRARLLANPSDEELTALISNAQVNVLPSFNTTGVKLKILNALFNGRHCLVNDPAVKKTGLQDFCSLAETPESFKENIKHLSEIPLSETQKIARQKYLAENYNNANNAATIIRMLH